EAMRVPGSSIVSFDADRPAGTVTAVAPGTGPAGLAEPTEPAGAAEAAPTELAAVVERLKQVGRPEHQVWLPPFPAAIPLDSLTGTASVRPGRGLAVWAWSQPGNLKIPIGVLDLPMQQQQQPLTMDFGGPHGHLAVVGAPQTGRSTALRTI